jgi:hypothetical protein
MHYDSYAFSKNGKPTILTIVRSMFALKLYSPFVKTIKLFLGWKGN